MQRVAKQSVEDLQQLDSSEVDPSLFSLEASNIYRADEPRTSLPLAEVLAIAPAAQPPYFLVPRIVADAGDESGQSSTPLPEGEAGA